MVPFRGAPAGTGDAYITQSAFPSCIANGLPARVILQAVRATT